MRFGIKFNYLSLAVAIAGGVPDGALAVEPADVLIYSRDPFQFSPRISISESYNDNLFSQPDGESDIITTISPGLNFQLGKPANNNLSLNYRFNRHFYMDRSDLNSGEHSLGLQSRLKGNRLLLTGSDSVQLLSSPIGIVSFVEAPLEPIGPGPGEGGEGSATAPDPVGGGPAPVQGGEVITTIGERTVDRRTFSDSYNLGYGISDKTGVYLHASYSATDYEDGVVLYDINTVQATGGFGYRAFPKTALLGEVFYGRTATTPNFPAPENPHSVFIGGSLGAQGEFTGKLSGSVRIGLKAQEFTDNTSAPITPVADVSLTHRVSDRTSLSLSFSQINDVSVQFVQESFTANSIRLQLSQMLGTSGKWRTVAGGGYGVFEYETAGSTNLRDFTQYSANFSLAYQIQVWLSAGFGYSYTSIQTDSSGVNEFDANQISLGVSVGY